jgi:hypothetical protein
MGVGTTFFRALPLMLVLAAVVPVGRRDSRRDRKQ